MAGEGLPVQLATRVLGVSESGYYAARSVVRPARAGSTPLGQQKSLARTVPLRLITET